jgi:sarcosine oxidase gamma subunit
MDLSVGSSHRSYFDHVSMVVSKDIDVIRRHYVLVPVLVRKTSVMVKSVAMDVSLITMEIGHSISTVNQPLSVNEVRPISFEINSLSHD